jgi:hypothetical protein
MRVGLSLSSGGLLLPYHLGVLDCLEANQVLTHETPIAGASAGAIAVATKACSIDSKRILDATIDISKRCEELGRARGNLMPLLRDQLEYHIADNHFEHLQDRPGETVLTYHELFPSFRAVHQVDFEHKEDLIDTICHSSAFPFFTSDWPVHIDKRASNKKPTIITFGTKKFNLQVPRLVVDGHFAVPTDRFGCPDFELAGIDNVDRTILVTVFPREVVLGMKKSLPPEDCICPKLQEDGFGQSMDLLRLATQPSTPSELISRYDSGYKDAEEWCRNEERRMRDFFLENAKNDRLSF